MCWLAGYTKVNTKQKQIIAYDLINILRQFATGPKTIIAVVSMQSKFLGHQFSSADTSHSN